MRLKCISLLVLLVSCLGFVPNSCQAGGNYQLTAQELSNIKYYINVIKQEKQNLTNDLQTCKISLQQAEERRRNLENQLNEALIKCKLLQEERDELEMLRKDLQESFEKSRKEAESRIRKLSIQRNVAVILGLMMFFI